MFDILNYIGLLPWIMKWVGRALSFVTRQPRFETFFAVEMLFLGNTEAIAVSKHQLLHMKPARNVTIGIMAISSVSAALIGAYTQLVPGEFVLSAIPLNCINALLVASMLFPVEVTKEEDVIVTVGRGGIEEEAVLEQEKVLATAEHAKAKAEHEALPRYRKIITRDPDVPKKEPFFSFRGDSILSAGRVILIVLANVVAFVALAALINDLLGFISPDLSLQATLGIFLYVPALLLGLEPATATDMSQLMGLKLVTNEFVVMGQVAGEISSYAPHYQAVLTVFLTSFANISTAGMIIGTFKGVVDGERSELVLKNVARMLLSGVLVSLLSACIIGVFVW
ncbi:nucleoside transporter C-terminal domain-containing protein [Flaviflexus ciconiae]|uniref:nucleoside transporter C-terminal domain-containing protein n=1 Tax=Flaviflexus ciconiae TaxID=2496867 RepID=UPI001D18D42E|nr:nucleoside transporter C-terminal domain-containing protein [Flaviflexus ciconiae]